MIQRYKNQEELLAAHPEARWCEYGPIFKYNGREFLQVYLGQHEWMIIDCEEPTKRYTDPGCRGTVFGFGYTPYLGWLSDSESSDQGVPEGFTSTVDEMLFGSRKP